MATEKILGIDLGTTFSAMAIMEGGKPTIISNSEGTRTTPSVVMIKGDERVVGQVARNQAVTNPDHVIRSIKRHMGTNHKTTIDGKDYSPQEISAITLQKMKADAESYLGQKITKAVITVPAYFTDSQRQATKDAGKIAGLDVLRIINEPTAGALAYGLDKQEQEHSILVFDFGGGTFDVSILELGDGIFEVKATAGNNLLGGDDVDEAIIDWAAEEFKKDNGIDLKQDKASHQRLRDAAEKAKIELSSKTSTKINIPYITADANGPKHLDLELNRAKFEQLIEGILKKLEDPTKQALKDAGVSSVDKIIFVGGSTRIPAVQEIVKRLTGKDGDKSVNPDEAVALGAAIQAGVLAGDVKDVLLLDVTPLSLGIETLGGVMTPVIDRNTTIPVKKQQVFSTAADNQPAVSIHVLQGERSMATDNKTLGTFDLTGIPAAPRGVPQIEVTFDIDANGILNVSAKDLGTGVEQKVVIKSTSNLSDDEVAKMQADAEANAESDKKLKDEIETINEADSLIYSTEKSMKEMEGKVDKEKMKPVIDGVEVLKKLMAADPKDIPAIKKELEELNKYAQEAATEMYQKAAQEQEARKGADSKDKKSDEKVVDADFEEQKDAKEQKD